MDDAPLGSLIAFAPELAETFVSVASDIALVVDLDGTIRSVAVGADSPTPTAASWVGRPWTETVTLETRRKLQRLLQEVAVSGMSRRCEVDHLLPSGVGVPVAYSAIRLGSSGPVLAAGRDLRAISAIQQRFVQTQQQMERDYWKRREAESRYRRLFQVATDAVLVVDAASLQIVEGNPAAAQRFEVPASALAGRDAVSVFDPSSTAAVSRFFRDAAAGRVAQPGEVRARLGGRRAGVDVGATPFRSGDADLLLVRLRDSDPEEGAGTGVLADFVERTPDAVVITDTTGHVLMANPAFSALCGVAARTPIEGRLIGEWLGAATTGGTDANHVLGEVHRHGIVQKFATSVRRADGTVSPVEVSATMLDEGDAPCIGLTLRPLESASSLPIDTARHARDETRALLLRVGEAPLGVLLMQAAELAERHFVARALEMADGDRTAAAALLGIDVDALARRLDPAVGRRADPDKGRVA
jgi:transcriptional regulator PpsR